MGSCAPRRHPASTVSFSTWAAARTCRCATSRRRSSNSWATPCKRSSVRFPTGRPRSGRCAATRRRRGSGWVTRRRPHSRMASPARSSGTARSSPAPARHSCSAPDRHMRIALVHPFSWPAVRRGGERYLHDPAWYLTSRGAHVDIVVGGKPGRQETPDGRLVRLRHPKALEVRGLTGTDTFGLPALGWLARHRYDVVHALTPTAALAAVATRQRTVYTALGHPTRRSISVRRHDLRMFRTTMHRVAAPLALSESAAVSITELVGVRAQVVPPGLRTAMFPLDDRPRTGPARILFPAHASDQRKGLDVLLQSFAQVLDRLPDARLVLGGGGDSRWAFDLLDRAIRERVSAATDEL